MDPGSFTYNADDEVSTDTFDNNGNTTVAGGKTFSYDSENHLMSMGSTVGLLYDGDGNRVAKSVSGVITRYLVDDLNPTGYPQVVEELSNSGAVERTYTYGLQRISQNQIVNSAWTPSFYETDGEGSVRQLTSAAGAVTDSYEYDAFGNKVNSTGTTPNNYLYRGEQFDPDLGMYYLRARYYNPLTGRFLGVDSQAGAGQRRYEYAGADPVNSLDPSGNEAIIEFALLTFYPKRLPFFFPGLPSGCGFAGAEALPQCGGPGGSSGGNGAGHGAPGGPPKPPPCSGKNCRKPFAELHYRHVPLPWVFDGVNANHAFWYIGFSSPDLMGDDEFDTYILDAGPANENCGPLPWQNCGMLVDWPPFSATVGHYPTDVRAAPLAWRAADPSQDQVGDLYFEANNWNFLEQHSYRLGRRWNSNSFAHSLADAAGFSDVTRPPKAPGW